MEIGYKNKLSPGPQVLAYRVQQSHSQPVIGFDTRFLSDRYATEIARVMAGNGIIAWLTLAMVLTTATIVMLRYLLNSGSIALQESVSELVDGGVSERELELTRTGFEGSVILGLEENVDGTLLGWLSDHESDVFFIGTSNDISKLPPEFSRAERFDGIFFVDLPTAAERAEIFAIHLRRRGRDKKDFDLKQLAQVTVGFTGAEIEEAILAGMYAAFAEGEEFATQHILDAVETTRPLSVVMHASSARSLRCETSK